VTVHIGTERGGGVTRVGNNNMLMVNSHLGHDVQMAPTASWRTLHDRRPRDHWRQRRHDGRRGRTSLCPYRQVLFHRGYARIHHDAPPFCKLDGADEMRGLNVKGLRGGGLAMRTSQRWKKPMEGFLQKGPDAIRDVLESFDVQNGLNRT